MNENVPHHYAALAVAIDSSAEELRAAVRQQRARWHPDALHAHGREASAARFVAVNEAAAVLLDEGQRGAYDGALQRGLDALLAASGQAPLLGLVDRIAGIRQAPTEAGRNRRLRLIVGLVDAVRGTERAVELDTEVDCQRCEGMGFGAEGRPFVCGRCAGLGEALVRGAVRSGWERCRTCHGRGYVVDTACAPCSGAGRVIARRTFLVPIPAGTASGTTLRVAHAGEPSLSGGPPGDLLVELTVENDARWRLEGADLRAERWIPFWRAATGGSIAIATPHGTARVQVPQGLTDGEVLRLSGWGVRGKEAPGDLYVTVRVEGPRRLDAEAREALARWAASLPSGSFPRSEAAEAAAEPSSGGGHA
jgi:molecular chaperone DnaJ